MEKADNHRTLLTVEAAAARLSLGRTTVYALIGRGAIRPVRVGRAVRLLTRDIDALAERLRDMEVETATATR